LILPLTGTLRFTRPTKKDYMPLVDTMGFTRPAKKGCMLYVGWVKERSDVPIRKVVFQKKVSIIYKGNESDVS